MSPKAEIGHLVRCHGCGVAIEPRKAHALAAVITSLASDSPDDFPNSLSAAEIILRDASLGTITLDIF
jgi:hypothetical protein